MPDTTRPSRTTITVVAALFAAAVLVAARSGHSTVAVLLILNGVLITGHLVRRRIRERLIYGRPRRAAGEAAVPAPEDETARA